MDAETVEYGYDAWNRMTSYTSADGTQSFYAYNANNERLWKTVDGTATKYYWDRGYVVNEADAEGITDELYRSRWHFCAEGKRRGAGNLRDV